MSYILNALRKSEQERKNKEPETLQHRIAAIQPHANPRTPKLIAVLVAVNVVLLGYFIWDHYRQKPEAVAVDKPLAQAEKEMKPVTVQDKQAASEPAQPQQALQRGENKPKQEPLPVAEIKKQPVKAEPIVAVKKIPRQAPAESNPVPEPVGGANPPDRNASNTAAALSRPSIIEDVQDAAPVKKPVVGEKASNPIPYVTELPYEFRKRLPPFDINVFVYSERAADSFVMIDMEKYKVGQRIHGQLELKEIRPSSLVVRFEDRTFQIERP